MNGIFEGCISLISFPDFHEKNSVMINDEAIPNCKMLLDINNIMVNNLILTNDLNQYLYTKLQFPHISGLQNLEKIVILIRLFNVLVIYQNFHIIY